MLHPPNNQIKKYNNTKQNAPQSTFRLRGYFTFRPHWWAIFKHLPLFLKLMHFSKHIPKKIPIPKKSGYFWILLNIPLLHTLQFVKKSHIVSTSDNVAFLFPILIRSFQLLELCLDMCFHRIISILIYLFITLKFKSMILF